MTTAASTEGFVAGPVGRTWYRRSGNAKGIPLVVVHGGPGATHDYLITLEGLGVERPVIFYDQLGAGRSDVPADLSEWNNDQLVEELTRVLDALQLERAHLLGQSWGGIVVTEYALRQPQRVVSLTLASPCLSVPRYAIGAAELRSQLPADVREILDRHEANGTTDTPEYEAASMVFYARHVCRLDPWPEVAVRTFEQFNWEIYRRLQGPSEFTITGIHKDYDITPRLHELNMPALITCGRFDEILPDDCGWYASLFPNGHLVVFEHSSHFAQLEEPERYLSVVGNFLRRADLRSS